MIDPPTLVWGARDYLAVSAAASAVLLALLALAYRRTASGTLTTGLRVLAAGLKILAIALLALSLMEPLYSGQRARPGANKFALLADDSQSMLLKDEGKSQTRGQQLKAAAGKDASWMARIGSDFDLRQFAFDSQLRTVEDYAALTFDGRSTDLGAALGRLLQRYNGQPLAGVLLFTDGSVTDRAAMEKMLATATAAGNPSGKLPPIYPVLLGDTPAGDVSVENIAVSQTNFEDAPVTLAASIVTSGEKGKTVIAELLDEAGKTVDKQPARVDQDGQPVIVRFRVKPEQPGLSFYKVRAAVEGQFAQFDRPETSREATLANNTRIATVDRGHGPYRVLYVTGRPNWEYKFLQRSLASDAQIELTGLIRVAKREPKFNFISRDSLNPLFKGFDPQANETNEQYDQPIIMRVTESGDKIEPHVAFPKTAEELDAYHAILLDRVESEFFTPDQMQLIKEFVRQRGGGLMMLGGQETFKNGKYDRTPIGDVLPVYCDEVPAFPPDATFRMALTREGWLEPFLRLRPEESQENQRLEAMPVFRTINAVRGIKPGATVLARAMVDSGMPVPAIVEQRFGQGRAAALLIGDLWEWEMRRPSNTQTDFEKAWRQMIRWLVADVPQRLEAGVAATTDSQEAAGTMHLTVQVRDAVFGPTDNAGVTVKVTPPDGKTVTLRAEPSLRKPGQYEADYVARQPGPYRATATVTAADGADLGQTETGWASDPAAEEFRALAPDKALLEHVARVTGGQMISADNLASFAASLPTRHAVITEPYVQPAWHQSWVFLAVIACLGLEWGLRRWKGLP
jgi:uncharacterized membrane protein